MGKPYYFPLALVILSVIGTTTLVLSTRWGVGLSPDSMVYIGAARSLLSGHGLSLPSYSGDFTPMTHYPPLFSAGLAGLGLVGIDPLDGARWLNALIFGANITLLGIVVYSYTRSYLYSVAGSFLMMGSLPLVQIHLVAWSEPLFIFCGLLGLFFLALYMERPNYLILAGSSIAVGSGFLARYAGITLVVTGVLGTFLLSRSGWRRRIFDILVFCSMSCIPIILWLVRNLVVAGSATNRQLVFHPLSAEHLKAAVSVISNWILPFGVPFRPRWITMLTVVTLLLLVFVLVQQRGGQDKQSNSEKITKLPSLLVIFIVNYLLFLGVSLSFFDAHVLIDNRILSPVYVGVIVLILCLARDLADLVKVRAVRIVFAATFLVFSVSQVIQAKALLAVSYSEGLGYASRYWKKSELIEYINDMDSRRPVFTNGADVVYLLTGRAVRMIPSRLNPVTRLQNSGFLYELDVMGEKLKEENGVLVYFSGIRWRWYLPSEKELKEHLKLHLLATEEDGSIYQVERKGNSAAGR